jgi:hypothetical protein
MCTRGIYQLRKIHLQFCDIGGKYSVLVKVLIGSSKGVRYFLQSDILKSFVKRNPQIEFRFMRRRGNHPFITSTYINGYIKDLALRNMNPEEILHEFERVRSSCRNQSFF